YRGQLLTLVVAFMGYNHVEYNVSNTALPIVIKLEEKNQELNEVVVTALGIDKQKRAIGYAATVVDGSEFTQARENNVANDLTGKVAGVNAIGISTGPGGSSRVTIRG